MRRPSTASPGPRLAHLALAAVALVSAAASRAAPAAPRRAELAAAQATFPELRPPPALRTDSLAPRLASWIRAGEETPVWVLDRSRRCEEAALRRNPAPARRGAPGGHPDERVRLLLRRCEPMAPDADGAVRRRCAEDGVGHSWRVYPAEVHETWFDGAWRATGGLEGGDPVRSYGVLSEVTRDAARYGGWEVRTAVRCVPREVRRAGDGRAIGLCGPRRHDGINAPRPWRVRGDGAPPAGLYRTPAACRRDAERSTSPPLLLDAE